MFGAQGTYNDTSVSHNDWTYNDPTYDGYSFDDSFYGSYSSFDGKQKDEFDYGSYNDYNPGYTSFGDQGTYTDGQETHHEKYEATFEDGFSYGFGQSGQQPKSQDPPVHRDLSVSLGEVYSGCTKKMKITKKVLNLDGLSTRSEDKILEINIKVGWKEGTTITFRKEGDQTPNKIPADIIFTLKVKPHLVFERDGADLILKPRKKVTLKEALCGTKFTVPTIDGRRLSLTMTDVINPKTRKRIHGEGLPHQKRPSTRGDIIVRFTIAFPDNLTSETKALFRVNLP